MKFSAILHVAFATIAFASPMPKMILTVGELNADTLYERVKLGGQKGLVIIGDMCPSMGFCHDGFGITTLCRRPSAKNCDALLASGKKGVDLAKDIAAEFRRTQKLLFSN